MFEVGGAWGGLELVRKLLEELELWESAVTERIGVTSEFTLSMSQS